MSAPIDQAKQAVRTRVWDLLVQERVVEPGVHGHIPTFTGADAAAGRLAGLPEWRAAQVIKAVPDRAQQPVRERSLRDGKLLYVAVPKLAAEQPVFVLDSTDFTTVHPLQVIDEPMPESEHDFSVDLIVTPSEVIACEPQRRPTGLYWNNLTPAKIAAIPLLAARAAARRR